MKLPAGTDGGTITSPLDEKFFDDLADFRGAVEIRASSGIGFILVDDGILQAAMFRTANGSYQGQNALSRIALDLDESRDGQKLHLRRYDDSEFARALELCRDSHLLVADEKNTPPVPVPAPEEPEENVQKTAGPCPEHLDEIQLKKILVQPGVIAVSAFFEGFPVQSMGDADFEHVAASAEDFMRAGVRIAQDMNAGPLDQMILETAENKFIIAPCGDLFLCVFTTAETQLGLIRVILKSIQSEVCR